MKYTRDNLIEKIIDNYCDADFDTILSAYRDQCNDNLSKLTNLELMELSDGLSITTEDDKIEEEKICCFCQKQLDETEKIHKSDDVPPLLWCDDCEHNENYLNI